MRAWHILKCPSTALAKVGVIAALISTLNWKAAERAIPRLDARDRVLVRRGKPVYASHCAACHGANLEGQPDWRNRRPNGRLAAPPHDPSGHTPGVHCQLTSRCPALPRRVATSPQAVQLLTGATAQNSPWQKFSVRNALSPHTVA
ncbi:c-type cytochrome [Cupriavidus sp. BIC8F]|uniref:c-type cytochrome n=1 Tax=Cupriavidus sp. BIC8F TaxID=3079014 RepID=UPI003966D28F